MRVIAFAVLVAACSSSHPATTGDGGHRDGGIGDGGSPDAPASPPGITGQPWYVRGDGGTSAQCDGQADAPYPGSGAQQHCAFVHPQFLWSDDAPGETAAWKIASGDTVIIRGGPYRMGYKDATTAWGYCEGDPYDCSMPPVPAGTAGKTTKIYGENFASCTAPTQLFGGFGLYQIVDLAGTQYVDVACLELTDHGSCTDNNVGSACVTSGSGMDDYATLGITTDATTANIGLYDLDLHGFVSRGIKGPIGGPITVADVRIAFNGDAGWDFDDGNDTPNGPGARVDASGLVVEWNGCNEEYPIADAVPAIACSDQTSGGYGDGVGAQDTMLDFTCDRCDINHNTQDGFDLLHASGGTIQITRSYSHSNMGQQWKLGPMSQVTLANVVTLANCRRMSAAIPGAPSDYNASLSLFCRAGNGAVVFDVEPGGTYAIENSTIIGYADVDYAFNCTGSGSGSDTTCATAKLDYENDITVDYIATDTGKYPATLYGLPDANFDQRGHNIYGHPRTCPTGFADEQCEDPKLVDEGAYTQESDLDAVDWHLAAGSPAIDTGVTIPAIATDYFGVARPQGSAYDIGAAEYQ